MKTKKRFGIAGKAKTALLVFLTAAMLAGCEGTGNVNGGNDLNENTNGADNTVNNTVNEPEDAETAERREYLDSISYIADPLYEVYDASAAEVSKDEMTLAGEWFENNILCVTKGEKPAFSFIYGNKNFADSMDIYDISVEEDNSKSDRISYTITMKHKEQAFRAVVYAVKYLEYPTVEWTLWLYNDGTEKSEKLTKVFALTGGKFPVTDKNVTLYHSKGSTSETNDFVNYTETLGASENVRLKCIGERGGSDTDMPYYNVDLGGNGVVVAIGWPGIWDSTVFNSGSKLSLTVQQTGLAGELLKGEKIRTPLVALTFYKGSAIKGNNLLRRWLMDCNTDYNQEQILVSGCIEYSFFTKATEENMLKTAKLMLDTGSPFEAFWVDTGWYSMPSNNYDNIGTWFNVGTWTADPARFPNGWKPVTDYLHENGKKFVLWMEPERAMPGTEIYEEHPEWLMKPSADSNNYGERGKVWRMVDFTNDECVDYISKLISARIKEYGVDIYRQDFNFHPNLFWPQRDTDEGLGRTGFAENKYVVNLLKYWDYLVADNPGLIIDNCAGGGRRLCLELVRRSQAYCRSDLWWDEFGAQNQTYGLNFWLPLAGIGVIYQSNYGTSGHLYNFRSCSNALLGYHANIQTLVSDPKAFNTYYKFLKQYLGYREYYTKDYYPLSPVTAETLTDESIYIGMQFNDSEKQEGMVQITRRGASETALVRVNLFGLEPNSMYKFKDIDGNGYYDEPMSGADLMKYGLYVQTAGKYTVTLLLYSKVK